MLPVDHKDVHDVTTMFEILTKQFNGLETEHLRLEAFKETRFYVEPQQYLIGS